MYLFEQTPFYLDQACDGPYSGPKVAKFYDNSNNKTSQSFKKEKKRS